MDSAPIEEKNTEGALNSKGRMGVGAEKPSGEGNALLNFKRQVCWPSEVQYWGLGGRVSIIFQLPSRF